MTALGYPDASFDAVVLEVSAISERQALLPLYRVKFMSEGAELRSRGNCRSPSITWT